MSRYTAVAYYGGIPPKNNNAEKPMILDYFCQGVLTTGDTAIPHRGMSVLSCDVALVQGFVHDDGKNLPHLQLRKDAVNLQRKNNKRTLIVDSNLFLYVDKSNPLHYLRYSFDGIFPTTGFYFDKDIDPTRWKKISTDLRLSLKPWRQTGSHILICLQRMGGWSMQGIDPILWMNETITRIRKYSDRKIVVRAHPGDKKIKKFLSVNYKNVSLSTSDNLINDLYMAWATVVFNSSPSVASIIEGVPAFITDPNPQHSQSYNVANTDISLIENPIMPDRQQWIEKISMCHWKFEELKSGEAWSFFRKYI
jgi:hypothetical protein